MSEGTPRPYRRDHEHPLPARLGRHGDRLPPSARPVRAGRWTPRIALATTRAVWRDRRPRAFLALALAVGVYLAVQAIGYGLAELVPYVSDNPVFAGAGAERRIVHYPPNSLQAIVLYAAGRRGSRSRAGAPWIADRPVVAGA